MDKKFAGRTAGPSRSLRTALFTSRSGVGKQAVCKHPRQQEEVRQLKAMAYTLSENNRFLLQRAQELEGKWLGSDSPKCPRGCRFFPFACGRGMRLSVLEDPFMSWLEWLLRLVLEVGASGTFGGGEVAQKVSRDGTSEQRSKNSSSGVASAIMSKIYQRLTSLLATSRGCF